MRWSWRAFRVGRPVRSTLTLLILVPRAPLPLEPARAPTRPCAPRTDPAALSPPRPHTTAGTPKGAASAVDTTPFRWILAQRARILAGDYGRHCPEGMLGVASALPDTRTFTT